jgi:hypothetical protein
MRYSVVEKRIIDKTKVLYLLNDGQLVTIDELFDLMRKGFINEMVAVNRSGKKYVRCYKGDKLRVVTSNC